MRYHGQGFEIPVVVDPAWLDDPDGAFGKLGETFDAEHNRLFSFLLDVDHELVNARATVTGPRPDVAPVHLEQGDGDPTAALRRHEHPIHVGGEHGDARVYDRAKLRAGDVITGPAIVTEMDSTTLVLPGHAAEVHRVRLPADQPRRRAERHGADHRDRDRHRSRRSTSTR